jgi:hypothetical protein
MSVDFMGARRRSLRGLGATSASQLAAVQTELRNLNDLYSRKYQPLASEMASVLSRATYQVQQVEQIAAALAARTGLADVITFVGGQAYVAAPYLLSSIKAGLAQAGQNIAQAKTLLSGTAEEAYANLSIARRLRTTADALVSAMRRMLDAAQAVSSGLGNPWLIGAAVVIILVSTAMLLVYMEKLSTARAAREEADRICAERATRGQPCDRTRIIAEYTQIQEQTGITGLVSTVVPDISGEAESFFQTGSNILWLGAAALGAYALWISFPAARETREVLYETARRGRR